MKSEVFILENVAWPTLLASATGEILQANTAAKNIFGELLAGDSPRLTAIWPAENNETATDFLGNRLKSSPAVTTLKFRTAENPAVSFMTTAGRFADSEKPGVILQLFADPNAGSEPAPPHGGMAMQQRLDCLVQLARTVALDFNNALTGVLAHTSLLLDKTEANHPWRHSLAEVEKSALRAAAIANELVQFSRQEKQTTRAPLGNLNLLVEHCVNVFRDAHGARFSWNLEMEPSLFEAHFEEIKIQQALTKIFENAMEAFGVGEGAITTQTRNVELTQAAQDRMARLVAGTYVCVEISDNGAGIADDVLPRIFDPFFTTKKSPHRGLGLALVYGIITNHGGGVAISSEPGAGTSVRIYLPAEKTRITETGLRPENNLRGQGTVLIVDDEELVRTMAEMILSDYGYTVLTAGNGQAALAALFQPDVRVDLLVTDLVMPGMSGQELIERIRRDAPHLPILCTTGYILPDDQNSNLSYLRKPFTSAELLRKVKARLPASKID